MNSAIKVWDVEVVKSRAGSLVIGVTSFAMLTAIGAWVRVAFPGTPVPITLQTFFVLLGGAVLGAYGGLAQGIYVMLGLLGVPVFAIGLGLLGPTGGYLIGFVVAAVVVGVLVRVRKSFGWVVLSMTVGSLVIYLFGALQLGLFLPGGFRSVFVLGVLPFVPGDVIKILTASMIYYRFQARFGHVFG
jgi:biotin transport system substrate-specific component